MVDQPWLFDPTPPRDPVRCPRCGWRGEAKDLAQIEDEWGACEACPACGEAGGGEMTTLRTMHKRRKRQLVWAEIKREICGVISWCQKRLKEGDPRREMLADCIADANRDLQTIKNRGRGE